MKPYSFVLPESFHPGEFLTSPALLCRWDDARYFVSLILTKLARGQVDDGGMIRLRAAYLRNVMHNRGCKPVVDALLEGGAVWRTAYKVGEKSFGYRLSDRFIGDRHVRLPISNARLIGRLAVFHEQQEVERLARMQPVHLALAKQQHRLRIHGDAAREIVAGLPPKSNPFDVQGVLVANIEHREFHCNVGRYGRLANNITSLKREVRETLHVGGRKLGSVDLSCVQPALLGKIIRDSTPSTDSKHGTNGDRENGERTGTGAEQASIYDAQPDGWDGATGLDLERYCSAAQAGTFYEIMVAELSANGIGREEFKRRFLADVIAKRKANRHGAEYPSVVEDTFRRLFPSVYRFIRQVNRDGWEHKKLIRQLQRGESALVIETVAADLVTRFPSTFFLTLHDAIYTTDEHLCKVEQAFRRAFDQTGFPMQFKVGHGSSSRGSHVTTRKGEA